MEPLPQEGQGRHILLTALRTYSDSCLPGHLHPDCPFAIPTNDGLACGDQCLDILGDCEDARSYGDVVLLAPGIAAVPRHPRARTGPPEGAPAFDAAQVAIEETRLPVARQSLTCILSGLANVLMEPPPSTDDEREKRRGQALGWIDELYRRSIDADALIRETLVEGMASVAVFSMVILILAGDDVPIDWTYPKRSGWVQLLLNTTEDVHEFTTQIRGEGHEIQGTQVARLFTQLGGVTTWMGSLEYG